MTLRDELERVIAAQWEPDAGDDAANWFIRDHGPALLEALVDAQRWRTFVEAGWPVCFLGETYDTVGDLNRAIDRARGGGFPITSSAAPGPTCHERQ
jgi:hypothetical protein